MARPLATAAFVRRNITGGCRRLTQAIRRMFGQLTSLDVGHAILHWLHVIQFRRLFHRNGQASAPSDDILSQIPLHALIIGINEYRSMRIKNLCGATSDADAFDEYLRTSLLVPPHQIVNLRDQDATRDAIIRELLALQTRTAASKGGSIVIFYAGYGTSANELERSDAQNKKRSFIVPHDGLVDVDGGRRIHPIPDQTLDALLRRLAEQNTTGGDITLILDCCYSNSRTGPLGDAPSRLVRGFELGQEDVIPADLDEHIWKNSNAQELSSKSTPSHPGYKPYILLAACREGGIAQEVRSRGLFTQALLEGLWGVSNGKIKYADLMNRIPNIPGQTPVCDGYDIDGLLFNGHACSSERILYEVFSKDDKIIIEAGYLQGLSYETEFLIHPNRSPTAEDKPLAIMLAKEVRASSVELTYSSSSPAHTPGFSNAASYFAARTSVGRVAGLRLHVALSESDIQSLILEALAKVYQPRTGGPAVLQVDDAAFADLSVVVVDGQVQYIMHEPLITACGLPALRQSTKAETKAIRSVLRGAAHFFRFLRHSPIQIRLNDLVRVEVYALEVDEEGELGADLRRPWITCGSDLYRSGFVDVVADDDTPYGIRLQNESDIALHVWAFYFDCSGLAISEYYRPPTAGHEAEPSLPAKDVLTIGYGSEGGLPYTFFLREGQDLDLGFIKLFISTEPIDFSSLEQRSPFKDPVARGKKRRNAEFDVGWDTVTITVVQRKPQ